MPLNALSCIISRICRQGERTVSKQQSRYGLWITSFLVFVGLCLAAQHATAQYYVKKYKDKTPPRESTKAPTVPPIYQYQSTPRVVKPNITQKPKIMQKNHTQSKSGLLSRDQEFLDSLPPCSEEQRQMVQIYSAKTEQYNAAIAKRGESGGPNREEKQIIKEYERLQESLKSKGQAEAILKKTTECLMREGLLKLYMQDN